MGHDLDNIHQDTWALFVLGLLTLRERQCHIVIGLMRYAMAVLYSLDGDTF